eukprot:1162102-Pelagomonas_calceolata.AAC.6
MNGNIIDGKAVAAQIREEITAQVAAMKEKYKRVRCASTISRGSLKHQGIAAFLCKHLFVHLPKFFKLQQSMTHHQQPHVKGAWPGSGHRGRARGQPNIRAHETKSVRGGGHCFFWSQPSSFSNTRGGAGHGQKIQR